MCESIPLKIFLNNYFELLDTTAEVNPEPFVFSMFYIFFSPIIELNTCGVYINLPSQIKN